MIGVAGGSAGATAGAREVVHLVPHTHWDREWYLPFQAFRLRLVALLDGLLDEMGRDPRVRFTLDGQTATVDDYLELRPENEGRIARLVGEGRLAIGPWAILMDEFLVSGETIVRDLELGVRRSSGLGRTMRVGYLPDMFGHVAQMPQILARAGIEDAVVWRGVPAAIDRHAFTWRAPDGSAVRTEYLYRGYGNARDVLDLPDRIGPKLDAYTGDMRRWFGEDPILAMYGEDHSLPLPGFADAVEAFNAAQDRYEVRVETLEEYLAATRRAEGTEPGAPTLWEGELRSGARANVLMGVTSHRIEVKQAAGRAERWLERRAEPLLALHGERWPERELAIAWRGVIEDAAHDSICACSAEETVQQVLARYATAEQIARGLVDAEMTRLARGVPAGAWVAWNPSPFERSSLVEIAVPADGLRRLTLPDGTPLPTQELGIEHAVLDDRPLAATEVVRYLDARMHARELYAHFVDGFDLAAGAGPDGRDVLAIDVSRVPDPPTLDVDALLGALGAEAARAEAAAPGVVWQLRVAVRPGRRVLASVPVPALGFATFIPAAGIEEEGGAVTQGAVGFDGRRITNGLVSVEPSDDGTLVVEGGGVRLAGVGRIVDGGDVGDSYNHAPPARDVIVERPDAVSIAVTEHGPLRGVLVVERTYGWPRGLTDDLATRDPRTVPTVVRMRVELHAGEPFVRIGLDFENASRDHRVRFHVPLPAPIDRSWAEGQFAVVERGLEMEGGHGEHPLPTFPAHGFAAADGVVTLLDHVTEYELVDGRELALTVLRSTGLISRDTHPWRTEPAGPVIEATGGQGIGPRSSSFALMPHGGLPDPSVLRALETYRSGFVLASGTATGSGPVALEAHRTAGLSIEGEGVVLTALRRVDDRLQLRVVNETPVRREATVRGRIRRAWTADILGVRGEELAQDGPGRVPFPLEPWEIRTLLLEPA